MVGSRHTPTTEVIDAGKVGSGNPVRRTTPDTCSDRLRIGWPVADSEGASPVDGFCADLRRRWRASGRDLPSVAREVRISRAQLYAILNGQIKRPPDFEALVRPLVRACGGTDAELAEWRRRHEVLVAVHVELRRQRVAPHDLARSAHDRAGTPQPWTSAPAQLPADVEVFVGRTSELSALDAATTRVVTITGTAGVGKPTPEM